MKRIASLTLLASLSFVSLSAATKTPCAPLMDVAEMTSVPGTVIIVTAPRLVPSAPVMRGELTVLPGTVVPVQAPALKR